MKPLATEFRKDGYDHKLLRRVEDVVLFEKRKGEYLSWEVAIVQHHGEYTIGGATIPAGESMPPTSQWGQKGWSCRTLPEADAKFDTVLSAERVRLAAKAEP